MKNEKKAKKIIFCVCCIGNIFLLFGCAKTETASADNTVTEESVINTTETITVEMPETVQVPSEQLADPPPRVQDHHGRGCTASHSGGGKLHAAGWKL